MEKKIGRLRLVATVMVISVTFCRSIGRLGAAQLGSIHGLSLFVTCSKSALFFPFFFLFLLIRVGGAYLFILFFFNFSFSFLCMCVILMVR